MSTAIANIQPQHIAPANPFEPQNLQQAMQLAETISKSGLVPSALRGKPSDILIILMTAREMRIGPMQALSDINVIQGKPVLSADLMVAQCKRATARCEWFRLVESTDDHATYQVKAVGAPEPETFTFSMDDARRMHLTDKDNWKKQPKTMLRRRAAAQAARETFPDLVRGYDPDEAEDFARPAVVRHVVPESAPAPAVEAPKTVDVTPVDAPPPPAEAAPVEITAIPLAPKQLKDQWAARAKALGLSDEERNCQFLAAAQASLGSENPPKSDTWNADQCEMVARYLFLELTKDVPF